MGTRAVLATVCHIVDIRWRWRSIALPGTSPFRCAGAPRSAASTAGRRSGHPTPGFSGFSQLGVPYWGETTTWTWHGTATARPGDHAMRILVVEDDPRIVLAVGEGLEDAGYSVT